MFRYSQVINASTHNVLVQWIVQKQLDDRARRFFKGRLIDIGCGEKPYQPLFAPYVSEHIGVDHVETFHDKSNVDIFGTAYDIPVPDASFDCAACTAVLEHLEEPERALRECHRVLKPGGIAVYSVPFIWHLHEEPRDFFRYSRYGLAYLFEKTGFEIVEITALSGFWVTFGQLFVYNIHRANEGLIARTRIIDAIGLLIQAAAYGLDKIDKTEQWTWMYMAVIRKRADGH